jgi:hypothetical protein
MKEDRKKFLLRRDLQFSVNISSVNSYCAYGYAKTSGNRIGGMSFENLRDHLGFSRRNARTEKRTHGFLDKCPAFT